MEEFGVECFKEQPDGQLLFQADYTGKENLLTWLLSFQNQAELLEPEDLRQELVRMLENTLKKYQ